MKFIGIDGDFDKDYCSRLLAKSEDICSVIEAIYGLWLFILKSGLASVYDPSRFG